jgi:hypothetical protein
MRAVNILVSLGLLAAPSVASAQVWPADDAWRVLLCGAVPSFDPVADEPAAIADRDVVGDAAQPALYAFSDATHFYFRMRVDGDPSMGGMFRPFGWAAELDTDDDRESYELLLVVDGIASSEVVGFHRNTTQATPNDPADPPEALITTYPIDTHARSLAATGPFASSFGGNADFFVDWAVPLADLEAEGVLSSSLLLFVMGTSTDALAVNADVACHDAASGAPTITDTATDPIPRDVPPVVDGGVPPADGGARDGGVSPLDGGDGVGLRGGPGACAIARGPREPGAALFLFALALLAAGRRRPGRRGRRRG